MARRKNAPDLVKVKCSVADRLREIRTELYGERGGPELARQLNLPVRTWYNYEAGVTVPAEVILRLIELTSVEATWLLHGSDPKFRRDAVGSSLGQPGASVQSVLRTALKQLERGEIPLRETPRLSSVVSQESVEEIAKGTDKHIVLVGVDDSFHEPLTSDAGPRFIAARREWQAAESDRRCLLVPDDAMAPLVARGAYVAYTDQDRPLLELENRLVVVWRSGYSPIVRWFQLAGRLALLRAENAATNPPSELIEIDGSIDPARFRAVSWISTPR